MASVPRHCALCTAQIGKNSYRNLQSDKSATYRKYMTELGMPTVGLICNLCFARFNRLDKIDCDIKTKVDRLKAVRVELISELRSKCALCTPKKTSKRPLQRLTPTPRAVKKSQPEKEGKTTMVGGHVRSQHGHVRKSFTFGDDQASSSTTDDLSVKLTENKGTQTHIVLEKQEHFHVKVVVKYDDKDRTYHIKDPDMQRLCKAIVNKRKPDCLVSCLPSQEVLKSLCKTLREEVNRLCRNGETLFKPSIVPTDISWRDLWDELKAKAPTLQAIWETVASKDPKKKLQQSDLPAVVTSAEVILFCRNRRLSQLQTNLGFILDAGGATKECITILNALGVSVSHTTIWRKKKALMKLQEDAVTSTILRYQNSLKQGSIVSHLLTVPADHQALLKSQQDIQTLSGEPVSEDEQTEILDDVEEMPADRAQIYTDDHQEHDQKDGAMASETEAKPTKVPSIEIIGDNVDVLVSPGTLTKDRQRKSWHWFVTLLTEKRITNLSLPCDKPKADIAKVPTSEWIPSSDDVASFHQDLVFHTGQVLLKYVEGLQHIRGCLPSFIEHEHMEETAKKSNFLVSKLIDASENTSEGMISILKEVHHMAVPHTGKGVVQRVVFGGDVLTNERAFSAQEAMQNASNELEALRGIIHRPEGLHREMNFLLTMYQMFYKEKSSHDEGSLYFLRNKLNRRDVTGPQGVTVNFRSHYKFIQDVIDGFIISEFLNLNNLDDCSSQKTFPVFSLMTMDERKSWLLNQAEKVLSNLQVTEMAQVGRLRQELRALSEDDDMINRLHNGTNYVCPECGKSYTRQGWFRSHLSKSHKWMFAEPGSSKLLEVKPLQCLLQMGLLLRDTYDAYSMCDGNRIFRNASFEWLYASAAKHYKYRLWLWRMMAYDKAILSEREAFEYRWNACVNT